MGYDYALVHLIYTIPPAVLLTLIYYPLTTRLDVYRVSFLILVAVTSTIPWDSYLIRTNIWSYPDNVIIGSKICDIPLEEVFFFVIQTYNTSLLYLLLSKPVLKSAYLVKEKKNDKWKFIKIAGQLVLGLTLRQSIEWIRANGDKTYLGLILVWAVPFLLLLWSLAYQLIVGLPWSATVLPVALPTIYLWIVDSLALQRGTWVISAATKTGLHLWPFGLEIEEAIFFLLTNCLIVAGLVAFDNAVAVLDVFPAHFPHYPELPSPAMLIRALLLPAAAYDDDRINGLQESMRRLKAKSRSFYLASGAFSGRLRVDLILLYSFCRVADDLVDNAKTTEEARECVKKLRTFLQFSYAAAETSANGSVVKSTDANQGKATVYAVHNFPADTQLSLLLLPTHLLDKEPLFELLKGFEMDLAFADRGTLPIKTEEDLDLYGARVAGTVALLCIQLVLHHYPGTPNDTARFLMSAGHEMGTALQYTNIARDLKVDAAIDRCYAPLPWLKKEKFTPESFLAALKRPKLDDTFITTKIESIRSRLLDRAFNLYEHSIGAIEKLPRAARSPMRVAVESYMQIGRELRTPGYVVKAGRATVPKWKRILVAWRRMLGPRPRSRPV